MAVLVLYGRRHEDAVAWPMLRRWLADDRDPGLRHCLIYDNSPTSLTDAAALPDNASLIEDPGNGGTAAAYAAAVDRAGIEQCEWLLLLDQDTALPETYLERAADTASDVPAAGVLVPRVRHGTGLVSPATLTAAGSVRPSASPNRTAGMTTAISSGALVRRSAIADIEFPPQIWLDYVDHWMFLELDRHGVVVAVVDADLSHDLSVRTPKTLSVVRLQSILAAEAVFYKALGGRARAILPFRRLMRAARYAAIGRPSLAAAVLRGFVNPTTARP